MILIKTELDVDSNVLYLLDSFSNYQLFGEMK